MHQRSEWRARVGGGALSAVSVWCRVLSLACRRVLTLVDGDESLLLRRLLRQ